MPEKPLLFNADKKLDVRVAKTQEELKISYQLRYQIYCLKMGTENPANFPDQEEKDAYDQCAISILAFYEDTLIGMVRLIPDTPNGFYGEKDIPFPQGIDRSKTVEISRLIVAPPRDLMREFVHKKIHLADIILQAAVLWCLKNQFTHWYGACNLPLYLHLTKKLYWGFQDLAKEPQIFHGTKVMPFILNLQNGKNTPFPYPIDEDGQIHFPEKQ